jgi:hypothetical protein
MPEWILRKISLLNEMKKTIQGMKEECNKDTEILKKSNWNPGNKSSINQIKNTAERLCNSLDQRGDNIGAWRQGRCFWTFSWI